MCLRALVRSWLASAVRVADTLRATDISRGASVAATRVGGGGGFATCGAATGISREATVAARVGGGGFATCGAASGISREATAAARVGDGGGFATCGAASGISREATVAARGGDGAGFAACGGFIGGLEARFAAACGEGAAFRSSVACAGGAAATELVDTMGCERCGIDAVGARVSTAIEPPELSAATAPGPLFGCRSSYEGRRRSRGRRR